jgi:high-affinity iron transporter
VAAGLFVSAVHTAHEATWVNVGQTQVADLSAVVRPGTPISSLLTGVLGIQPQPTLIEVVAWLIYLVPMLVFVLWPVRRPARSSASATADASA